LSFREGDALPFAQIRKGNPFDGRLMEEEVLSARDGNEAEPFVRQPLDYAFSHVDPSLKRQRPLAAEHSAFERSRYRGVDQSPAAAASLSFAASLAIASPSPAASLSTSPPRALRA